MKNIIEGVADNCKLNRHNIRRFLDEAFDAVTERFGLCKDFQARAAKFGEAFEICFEIIVDRLYPKLEFEFISDVELPKACMVRVGKADFAVFSGTIPERKVIAVIETKGAAEKITCNGKKINLPRPGLLRTDTVKKAISNAYQVSRAYPDALFFIVTSHKPVSGNARCMCDLAEGDIVDKIVDVTDAQELDLMIHNITSALKK
jgi:hypothetical protein